MIREKGEVFIFEVFWVVLEVFVGSLLWLIKVELCFLLRVQSVNGFKREKLSFYFYLGVMDRISRMKMRRKGFLKGRVFGLQVEVRFFLKCVIKEILLVFRGGGGEGVLDFYSVNFTFDIIFIFIVL